MPYAYPKRSDPRSSDIQANNSQKPLVKPSAGLSKSTKTLLIIVLIAMSIALIWIVVRAVSNPNTTTTPVDKLTANLQISQVQIVNYTDLKVRIEIDSNTKNIDSVDFVIYNEDNSILTKKKVPIQELENSYLQVSLHTSNTSKIKGISVIPTFISESGAKVLGKVEYTYNVSDEEKYREAESPQEDNTSDTSNLPTSQNKSICISNFDCNDNNSCTDDTCSNGNCSYTLIEGCAPCTSATQCEDSNNCTTNVCSEGRCIYLQIPGCTFCASSSQCNDNNSCTSDVCILGRCLYNPVENCKTCTTNSECEDNNSCTSNLCVNNTCSFPPISNCTSCTSVSQCTGAGYCQTASCSNNKCNYNSISSCISNDGCCAPGCTSSNDNDCPYICGNGIREGTEKCDNLSLGGATCAGVLGAGYTGTLKCSSVCTFDTSSCIAPCTCPSDNNSCTIDACISGVCQHTSIPNCCTSSSQCDDGNSCTSDNCSGGVCTHNALTGTSCDSDGNNCTNDICLSDGTCGHDPLEGNPCSSDNNACTTDACSSSGDCLHSPINSCINGDGCCPAGCTPLNDNDCVQCTSANQATSCNDNNVCTNDICSSGICTHTPISNCCTSATQCTGAGNCQKASCTNNLCSYSAITSCTSGDSCCPSGCVISTDSDCSAKCGDGIVNQVSEKCDGTNTGGASCASVLGLGYTGTLRCTSQCTYNTTGCVAPCTCPSDNNVCTVDRCVNNVCQHTPITSCAGGDGCCPSGCTLANDNDCSARCGDGIINQASEKCDGTNGGATCAGVLGAGYSGTLKCTSQCTFDTSSCVAPCTCASDNNICTTDVCQSNVCQHVYISGCCNSNAECGSGKVCTGNICVTSCTTETNAAFCSRFGKNCGTLTGTDNCGNSRTVTSCGTCTSPQTCGGSGTSNLCGGSTCTAESNSAFCSRYTRNCGSLTGLDNCGTQRTVTSCGSCTSPQTCGGSGTTGVCGSASCTVTSYTPALNTFCGSKTVVDNCGVSSTKTGTISCSGGQTCNSNGVCTTPTSSTGTIIIDHTTTNINNIPSSCINKVKANLNIAYTHTSHGEQLYQGLEGLMDYNSLYSFSSSGGSGQLHFENYVYSGLPTGGCTDLSVCDGSGGIASPTEDFLNGNQNINVIMWAWCSIAGHDIPSYLSNMETLITEYPNVKFVFFTGHSDGEGEGGTSDSQNNIIRDFINNNAFCKSHQCIFFDYADMENYDPDNNYFLNKGVNADLSYNSGNWGVDYMNRHSSNTNTQLTNILINGAGCTHSDTTEGSPSQACLNCALKGQAVWYMYARMVGWDGNPSDGC